MKNKKLWQALSAFLLAGTIKPFPVSCPEMSLKKNYAVNPSGEESKFPVQTNYIIKKIREHEKLLEDTEKISAAKYDAEISGEDWIYRNIDYLFKALKIPYDSCIDKEFVRAIVFVESDDTPSALGKIGEKGLMQITETAWRAIEKSMDYKRAFEPLPNLDVGIRYLLFINEQCERFYPGWEELSDREKRKAILAGYNWGIWSFVTKGLSHEKMPPITKRYVKLVEEKEEESKQAKRKYLQSAGDNLVWRLH